MSDIREAIPHMKEPDKILYDTLLDFYEGMKALESDPNRVGKRATLLVMTANDITEIFEKK